MIAKINSISAFDATDEDSHTLSFSWDSYATRVTSLRCVIKHDNTLVYQKTITYADATGVFQFELIPKSKESTNPSPYKFSLKNGNTYKIWIIGSTDGTYNDELTTSNMTYFECISAPSLKFNNLDGSVENNSYTFNMTYYQTEGRKIESLLVKFRANIQSEATITSVPINDIELDENNCATVTYTITGVSNSQLYYVQAYGSCDGGMSFDTGTQAFSPVESGYQDYHFISALNMSDSGGIRVSTNIISANPLLYDNGNLVNTEESSGRVYVPSFIRPSSTNTDSIDLHNRKLVYNRGYIIDGDFDFLIHCRDMKPNTCIATLEYLTQDGKTLENPNVVGKIYYREGYNGTDDYHSFFEYIVEGTYIADKGTGQEATVKSKRIYFSTAIEPVNWDYYENAAWSTLTSITWSDMHLGLGLSREFGVRITRSGEYYSVKCIAYDLA